MALQPLLKNLQEILWRDPDPLRDHVSIIYLSIPMSKLWDLASFHYLYVAKIEHSCTYCCKKYLVFATFATHICTGGYQGLVTIYDVPLYVHM